MYVCKGAKKMLVIPQVQYKSNTYKANKPVRCNVEFKGTNVQEEKQHKNKDLMLATGLLLIAGAAFLGIRTYGVNKQKALYIQKRLAEFEKWNPMAGGTLGSRKDCTNFIKSNEIKGLTEEKGFDEFSNQALKLLYGSGGSLGSTKEVKIPSKNKLVDFPDICEN